MISSSLLLELTGPMLTFLVVKSENIGWQNVRNFYVHHDCDSKREFSEKQFQVKPSLFPCDSYLILKGKGLFWVFNVMESLVSHAKNKNPKLATFLCQIWETDIHIFPFMTLIPKSLH